jgi:hypothetical protein
MNFSAIKTVLGVNSRLTATFAAETNDPKPKDRGDFCSFGIAVLSIVFMASCQEEANDIDTILSPFLQRD